MTKRKPKATMLDKVIEKIGLATYGGTAFEPTGEYREKLTNILVSFLNYSSGDYPNFHQTIINSKEWQAWEKEIIQRRKKYLNDVLLSPTPQPVLFDTDESRECDMFSPAHWEAFVEFIRSKI